MVGPGAVTEVGPELSGIVGRKAAAIANYPMYSDGMKTLGELGVVWTEEETLRESFTEGSKNVRHLPRYLSIQRNPEFFSAYHH